MSTLDSFKALYCGGAFIADPAAVTAMSLLFERIYLPNDLEIVADFARTYRFVEPCEVDVNIEARSEDAGDPFAGLNNSQRATAMQYLGGTAHFVSLYAPLYGTVFEAPTFPRTAPSMSSSFERERQGNSIRTKSHCATK